MKRKILIFLTILGIAINGAEARYDKTGKNVNEKAGNVVEAFIEASMRSDAGLFSKILNNEAVLKINQQNQSITQTKSELIRFYRGLKGVVLNCEASHEILSSDDHLVVARVDFKFPQFVQQNYITIEKGEDGQWKVIRINRFNV